MASCVLTMQDIVIILLCVIGLGAGGVIGALGANTWTNLVAQIDIRAPVLNNYMSLLEELRIMLIATAVSGKTVVIIHVSHDNFMHGT